MPRLLQSSLSPHSRELCARSAINLEQQQRLVGSFPLVIMPTQDFELPAVHVRVQPKLEFVVDLVLTEQGKCANPEALPV